MNDDLHTIDPANRTAILVHYYRAMVGRADVWRTRMDTTTNWAIGATAAIVSFTLGDESVPHYVVSIATLMTWSFLLLESRRLTFYHLFQQRVLLLEEGLMRPALAVVARGESHVESDARDGMSGTTAAGLDLSVALERHLGRTVPTMPLIKAVARRLRRVYLYLFAIQVLAWVLKLVNHPTPAASLEVVIERADTGVMSGEVLIGVAVVLVVAALVTSVVRGGVDRDPA